MMHKIFLVIRHLSWGVFFLLSGTSCESDLPRSKTDYLQRFESFTQVFTERLPDLSAKEFQYFNEHYRLLSQDYYLLFDEKLSLEEKKQIWKYRLAFLAGCTKYRLIQDSEPLFEQFENYILGPERAGPSSKSI